MYIQLAKLLNLLIVILFIQSSWAKGTLSENIQIDSTELGYKLQFRVYTPSDVLTGAELPTIYITDGQWYIDPGNMIEVLDREIDSGNIEPVIAVFVDSRNPDDLSENRRNEQFMCNQIYAKFFLNELIPFVSNQYPVSDKREDRVIAGVSFGGLNAACFGLMIPNAFGGVGMHSPANGEHLKLLTKLYAKNDRLPIKMFFSTGTKNDNTRAARRFHSALEEKGYAVEYVEVPFGHTWDNWGPLIDDMLHVFFKKDKQKS